MLAIVTVMPAYTLEQVMTMDAMSAFSILGARMRQAEASGSGGGGASDTSDGWRDMPNGTRQRRISNMADLANFLGKRAD